MPNIRTSRNIQSPFFNTFQRTTCRLNVLFKLINFLLSFLVLSLKAIDFGFIPIDELTSSGSTQESDNSSIVTIPLGHACNNKLAIRKLQTAHRSSIVKSDAIIAITSTQTVFIILSLQCFTFSLDSHLQLKSSSQSQLTRFLLLQDSSTHSELLLHKLPDSVLG